ncbi:Cold regulated protein 27, putative isoform 2 [Hibiscus syriacus]|uniref:Cold regulated protein 27, putative isoform 2 n=1 Tax=Hibiscus syriacus TaxID=106335 RepID=A0A6A3AU72_HIBSY|nr:Cold regulated protein 27, putative isoform 2 [Hibiscus syriacus]
MVWTNEKHNSYLDFLEASFVKKLHYSKSLCGCHQQMGMWEQCPFPQQPPEGHHSSHQFSVLRDGYGQKMNYKNHDHFLESTAESGAVMESPMLGKFTSADKRSITFPVPRETVVPNDGIYLRNSANFSCKSAVNSEQNPIFDSCNHNLDSYTAEASDQNFVDEYQEEKTGCMSGAKRLKMSTVLNASSNFQVAPVGKLHTTDDSMISYMSEERGGGN